ncbi:MAG TPA: hypothetical protein EYO73_04900 [Sulfurimonas sp.]|nr:hypothetical protein [Sulfurimonas sp.]
MKKILVVSALLSAILMAREMKVDTNHQQVIVVEPVVVTVQAPVAEKENTHVCPSNMQEPLAQKGTDSYKMVRINVVGQGVAPTMTSSPAQAYALAKRAAIADAYRLLAEKVKGVRIEGSDKIKNMMVQRSEIRTFVDAVIAQAEIIETVFKDGLCEVEMELNLNEKQWNSILASR